MDVWILVRTEPRARSTLCYFCYEVLPLYCLCNHPCDRLRRCLLHLMSRNVPEASPADTRALPPYPSSKNEYKTTGTSPAKRCTTFIFEYCKWPLIRVIKNSVYIMQMNVGDTTLRFVVDTGNRYTIIQTTQDSFCQRDANHCSNYGARYS